MKCERYWPENDDNEAVKKFGGIQVRVETTQDLADYTIRRLSLVKVRMCVGVCVCVSCVGVSG